MKIENRNFKLNRIDVLLEKIDFLINISFQEIENTENLSYLMECLIDYIDSIRSIASNLSEDPDDETFSQVEIKKIKELTGITFEELYELTKSQRKRIKEKEIDIALATN
ncbi:MAG: hypothetical protein E6Y85_05370 [Peptoniphilus harei]|nr:hypothetical protein [Peptoniphilus harei]